MSRALILSLALLALVAVASLTHQQAQALRADVAELDRHVVIPSPEAARVLSLGLTEVAADVAWVRMLIYYGDGLINDTGMPDTEALVRLVNVLDPYFRKAYMWGAYATTMRSGMATNDEYASSIEVLKRGLKVFPNDWEFNWILGVRLFMEVKGGTEEDEAKRKEEGVMYIERAMHNPKAPPDLPLLAASLRTQLGHKEQALRDLREMILNIDDAKAREKLQARYNALASETAGNELAAAASEFDQGWKAHFPYASRSFYVLLGSTPSSKIDLETVVRGDTFDDGPPLASGRGE